MTAAKYDMNKIKPEHISIQSSKDLEMQLIVRNKINGLFKKCRYALGPFPKWDGTFAAYQAHRKRDQLEQNMYLGMVVAAFKLMDEILGDGWIKRQEAALNIALSKDIADIINKYHSSSQWLHHQIHFDGIGSRYWIWNEEENRFTNNGYITHRFIEYSIDKI